MTTGYAPWSRQGEWLMEILKHQSTTLTVDQMPPTLKSGDRLHAEPCVFQSLLKSAESDLDRRRNQIRSLKIQRAGLMVGLAASALIIAMLILRAH